MSEVSEAPCFHGETERHALARPQAAFVRRKYADALRIETSHWPVPSHKAGGKV